MVNPRPRPPDNISPAATQPIVVTAPNVTQAASGPVVDPNVAVNSSTNVAAITRFPLESLMYYMTIGVHKYSRASWASVGTLSPAESTIVLPVPEHIVDTIQQRYDSTPLGLAGGIGMSAGGAATSGQSIQNIAKGAAQGLPGVAASVAASLAGAVGGAPLDAATRGILASQGKAVNDFLTILYKGPAYKTFQFSWRLSPRSMAESRAIKEIEMIIKNAQSPSWSDAAGAFFSWPRLFTVQFSHPYTDMSTRLFKMKPGVVTACAFDYAPGGVPAFYGASQFPEGVAIQIMFEEIELWVNSSDNVQDAYTNPDANKRQINIPVSPPNLPANDPAAPFVGG